MSVCGTWIDFSKLSQCLIYFEYNPSQMFAARLTCLIIICELKKIK